MQGCRWSLWLLEISAARVVARDKFDSNLSAVPMVSTEVKDVNEGTHRTPCPKYSALDEYKKQKTKQNPQNYNYILL
jgi:hypothetical protein